MPERKSAIVRMSRIELTQAKIKPRVIDPTVYQEASEIGWKNYLRIRRELRLDDPRFNHPSATLMQRHCDI